jgi:hypothetical protein
MKKRIGLVVVCLLGLSACNVEHYDDCEDESFDFGDDYGDAGGKPAKPAPPGNQNGEGGAAEPMEPPITPCEVEHDCGPGFNCEPEAKVCVAADAETCGELTTEAECSERPDCTPIYGGTNCSCGADCECKGGEPGCVCEEFGFVVCR